jgi:dethiobiotin synthetase
MYVQQMQMLLSVTRAITNDGRDWMVVKSIALKTEKNKQKHDGLNRQNESQSEEKDTQANHISYKQPFCSAR